MKIQIRPVIGVVVLCPVVAIAHSSFYRVRTGMPLLINSNETIIALQLPDPVMHHLPFTHPASG